MLNNQGTRNMRSHVSNPQLAVMTGEYEFIGRNCTNKSFLATFQQAEIRSNSVQDPGLSLAPALESDT